MGAGFPVIPAYCPKADARWATLKEHVARTEAGLADLAVGTRVVTYQGFGGEMPGSYALAGMETVGDGQLALWIKRPGSQRARSPSWTHTF